jgi:4-hydroxybenzoyl-CoA reductase subunit beta
MLRLPAFELLNPSTVDEALELLATHGEDAMPIAGGTDLLPNMKHELFTPKVLVSLSGIESLKTVRDDGDQWWLGAGCTLHDLAQNAELSVVFPALTDALGAVAGPHHRRMATLGGNICLDTRCLYYNQTHFWRESLGFCLKKDGDTCHVAGGRKCVAAASNDSAPPLIVYQAEVEVLGPNGSRRIPMAQFYVPDGIKNTCLEAGELVLGVHLPKPAPNTRAGFHKMRRRDAIDFPLLNMAVLVECDEQQVVRQLRIAVSALAARPNIVRGLDKLIGETWSDELEAKIVKRAQKGSVPLTNLATDPKWRRAMVPVFIRRLLQVCAPTH